MTFGTNQIGVRACQGENLAVIKGGKFPTGDDMTFLTGCACTPCMPIIFLMTGNTGGRRAFKPAIQMTLVTTN